MKMKSSQSNSAAILFALTFSGASFGQTYQYTTSIACLDDEDCEVTGGYAGTCGTRTAPWGTSGQCEAVFCSNSSQCPTSETCQYGACTNSCSSNSQCPQGRYCSAGRCQVAQGGDAAFCLGTATLCGNGWGDCDSDAQCAGNLVCAFNVGASYGWSSSTDVCTNYINGHADFCTYYGPCARGEGDCENDQCEWGTYCKEDVGAQFGFSAGTDVCVYWWE